MLASGAVLTPQTTVNVAMPSVDRYTTPVQLLHPVAVTTPGPALRAPVH